MQMDLSVQLAGRVRLASPWLTRSHYIREHLGRVRNEVIRNGLVHVD